MRLASSGGRRLTPAALSARERRIDTTAVSRKELAAAARDAMKAIKLRPSMRLVLAELVGCWGEILIGDRILVWPSNDYLVQRTGLSERAVRYGIRGLIQAELIATRDSANGKRYAVKNRAGEVVDIFGFDLTALYARRQEWADAVVAGEVVRHTIRLIFDEITVCRRAAQDVLATLSEYYPAFDTGRVSNALAGLLQQTPRRNLGLTSDALSGLLARWRSLRSDAENLFKEAASGGNSCLHIETNPESSKTEQSCQTSLPEEAGAGENSSPATLSVQLVVDACPAISAYGAPLRDLSDLVSAARFLRGSLGASPSVWDEAVATLGPPRAALAVLITLQNYEDDAASGANRIKNPGGYLRAMVRLVAAGKLNPLSELLRLKNRHKIK